MQRHGPDSAHASAIVTAPSASRSRRAPNLARGTWLERWSWVVLPLVVLLAVTLPKLGQGDWRGDTGWYSALALDAARSGRWTLSAGAGEPYFNKPPLVFWILGAALRWLSPSLMVARLTSVLAAGLGVVATAGIARELGSRRLATLAGVILALTYEYFRRTREVSLDMWHGAFLVLAVWCVACGVRRVRPVWVLAAGLPIGLALLTKPLVALAAVPILGAWVWRAGGPRLAAWLLGTLAIGIAIALPWHLWQVSMFGDVFLDQYFGREIAARASGQLIGGQKATQPVTYYFMQVMAGYWPWLVGVAGALATRCWRTRAGMLALVWSIAWLALLSAFPDRRDRYAIPIYPGLAILAALGARRLATGRFSQRRWHAALRAFLRWVAPLAACSAIVVALLPIKVQSSADPQWVALEKFVTSDPAHAALYEGASDGAPAARVYLITGAWPIPTRDAADRPLAMPTRGSLLFYHRRGGRTPGPGESVVFQSGDLTITRLDADAWSPTTIADPGE